MLQRLIQRAHPLVLPLLLIFFVVAAGACVLRPRGYGHGPRNTVHHDRGHNMARGHMGMRAKQRRAKHRGKQRGKHRGGMGGMGGMGMGMRH